MTLTANKPLPFSVYCYERTSKTYHYRFTITILSTHGPRLYTICVSSYRYRWHYPVSVIILTNPNSNINKFNNVTLNLLDDFSS